MIVTRDEVKAILNITDDLKDAQIDLFIPFVQQDIIDKTRNNFTQILSVASSGFSFVNSTNDIDLVDTSINLTDYFQAKMDIYISGSLYNNFHFEILTVTAQKLELNDLVKVIDEDTGEGATLTYVIFPTPLKMTASLMINYRIKNIDQNVKSEKIGKYNVTYRDNKVAVDYPEMILSGLTQYKHASYT